MHVDSYFALLRFDGAIDQDFRLLLHHPGRQMGTTRLRPSASLRQRSGRSRDVELQRRNTTLNMFDDGDKAVRIRFQHKLATRMVNSHSRLGGAIAFTTVSTDQIVKILKQDIQQKD